LFRNRTDSDQIGVTLSWGAERMRPVDADPGAEGRVSNAEGVCPLCDRHCPLSAPSCGKGRRLAAGGGA
jgi:hypothetical protein